MRIFWGELRECDNKDTREREEEEMRLGIWR